MHMAKSLQRIDRAQLTRQFTGYARVLSEDKRQVELSFSSEQPYERWFGVEILCHDEGAISLSRMDDVGSLLFHHGYDPNYGSVPVGRIEKCWLDSAEKRGKAVVEFDSDEKSELIFQKVKSGAIRGVSVGYRIEAYEEVKTNGTSSNGRFKGPCVVATKWSPYEISIEPTPADDSVGVGRSLNTNQKGEIESMDPEIIETEATKTQTTAPPAAVPTPTPAQPDNGDAVRQQATAAERTRITEITNLCRDFGIDASGYITAAKSVDEVRQEVLAQLRAGKNGQRAVPAANAEVTADEADKFRKAARDGMLMRVGIAVDNPAAGASEFRGQSLRSLAANCMQRAGVNTMLMDDEQLFRAALGFDETRGVFAPDSAFVSIIGDTMGAVISSGYNTTETTFQLWTGKGSNPNFKATKRFRLSGAGEIVEIPQGGEFKSDKVEDEGVDTQLKTFGKKFGFSRQAFINDDLGTIAKAILAQTRSVKRTINKKVYQIIGQGANYIDGKPLFDAAQSNLGTTGALSTVTLGELFVLMRQQKNLGGKEVLNISPKFGLFPATLQMEAWKLLNSIADPGAAHSGVVNPLQGKLIPIVDAELDVYSKDAFYTVASPAEVDTIEVAYLNGKEEPTLESRVAWDILGIEYRMYHDFAVSLLDYRGLNKNKGK